MSTLTAHNIFDTVDGLVAVGTLALAVGTLVVAVVTGKTARRTRELAEATMKLASSTEQEVQAVVDQAKAAREEVEVSREALVATQRPRLVNIPLGLYVKESKNTTPSVLFSSWTWDEAAILVEDGTVSVPSRNVGSGVALIQNARLRWHELGSNVAPDESTYFGVANPTVLPPNEFTRVRFTFGPEATARLDALINGGAFAVEVDYQDMSAQLSETTRLDIVHTGDHGWRVRQVHFYRTGEATPYASSGVGAERDET